MSRRRELWRRPEATRGYAHVAGIFNSSPICQHPQCCHRQHQPMPRDPCGVSPSRLLPLPPNTLKPSSIQKRSPYQHTPASTGGASVITTHGSAWSLSHITIIVPRRRLLVALKAVPAPTYAYPGPGMRDRACRRVPPSGQNTVLIDCRIGVPSHRAYLLPQSRTPQTAVIHHQHRHISRDGFGQQLQQAHCRGHSPGLLAGRMCQAMGIAQLR